MLKIGQNWGKIANYHRNAQQNFAPLSTAIWHHIRPELVGFVYANRHFFV